MSHSSSTGEPFSAISVRIGGFFKKQQTGSNSLCYNKSGERLGGERFAGSIGRFYLVAAQSSLTD